MGNDVALYLRQDGDVTAGKKIVIPRRVGATRFRQETIDDAPVLHIGREQVEGNTADSRPSDLLAVAE